jgi:Type VI secretion system/phage-baseplate injector OB domain
MKNFYGVYLGTVLGTGDPSGRGRMQVAIPSLGIGPLWARVCNSAGGKIAGTAVVGFEAGDASQPIILGFVA